MLSRLAVRNRTWRTLVTGGVIGSLIGSVTGSLIGSVTVFAVSGWPTFDPVLVIMSAVLPFGVGVGGGIGGGVGAVVGIVITFVIRGVIGGVIGGIIGGVTTLVVALFTYDAIVHGH